MECAAVGHCQPLPYPCPAAASRSLLRGAAAGKNGPFTAA
nr:MAG TPA: hypothetical protein [Caudoviricetes sp.]